MFRLAHITDPHIGPLPPARLHELASKRVTGWLNWYRGRNRTHDPDILSKLVADLLAQAPDHIACTGDISNIGLPSEWPIAKRFLEQLGSPENVSFVPGNHDAYVAQSLPGLLAACRPYLLGDASEEIRFPYLRRRGGIALIGLSTAIATPPFKAYGALGPGQLQHLDELLRELGRDPACCRVVLIHHPPYVGGASDDRGLKDAPEFERVIAAAGAELIVFGHNHVASLVYLDGPQGQVPVVGAPSVSSSRDDIAHRAAYHLFHIDRAATGFSIELERRGRLLDGDIGELGRTVVRPRAENRNSLLVADQ